MKGNRVTIKDIARQLNISPSTVSRALQNHQDISGETKKQVNDLALKLKYQPNAVALSLKHNRSFTIGVIIPEIVHYFFSSVISGIEDVAYKAGFAVIICQSDEKYDREVVNVKTLLAQRVDGILVSVSKETQNFEHIYDIRDAEIPLVMFDRIVPGLEADQVIIDDREAAFRATQHLIDIGKKRIAHFAGPQNLLISQKRMQGYMQALQNSGLPINQNWIVEADNYDRAKKVTLALIESGNIPDAIFAVNDITAIGAMKTFQKAGFSIPKQVAIVGFSDGLFSDITDPSLTSVDQHGYEMGMVATNLLLNRIRNSGTKLPPETKVLKADLIIRESSKFI